MDKCSPLSGSQLQKFSKYNGNYEMKYVEVEMGGNNCSFGYIVHSGKNYMKK